MDNLVSRFGKKVERGLIYGSIFLLLVAESLATLIPAVRNILDSGGSLFLIALVLLSIFRFLDERLPDREKGFESAESFGDGVTQTLGSDKQVREMLIFAHTSSKYYGFIRDKKIKIENLKLLLCDPKYSLHNTSNPVGDGSASNAELNLTISNWLRLMDEGLIGSLEIRKYNFNPSFHYMIVDGRRGEFGFFRAVSLQSSPYRTMTNFIFTSKQTVGKNMINDMEDFFDMVFRDFSVKVEIPGKKDGHEIK